MLFDFQNDHFYHYRLPEDVAAQQAIDPLLQGLYRCSSGYFSHAEGHFADRSEEIINEYIFIYCTAGRGWVNIANTHWTIQSGELIFIPANMPHQYGASDDDAWTIYWFHFSGSEATAYQALFGVTAQEPVVWLGEHFTIVRLFQQLLRLCSQGYSRHLLIRQGALIRQILSDTAMHTAYISTKERELDVERIIHFMQSVLTERHTVADFAAQANLSVSHFSRLFQQKTGYPPMDYFIRLKMQRACEYLSLTDYTINIIAQHLGYTDVYYFSRIFKKIIGIAPSHYRQKRRDIIVRNKTSQ